MAANREATGLVVVRLFLGVFFLFQGLGKLGWLLKSDGISRALTEYAQQANSWNAWFLQSVALPYQEIFARLVVLGELSCGVALLAGLFTRTAGLLGFLMVLSFHFASGALFRFGFLTLGTGLPVLGGLLALAIGAGRLPWSVRG